MKKILITQLILCVALLCATQSSAQDTSAQFWKPGTNTVSAAAYPTLDPIFLKDVSVSESKDTPYGRLLFYSGVAKYEKNDKYGLMDINGNVVVSPQYENIYSLDCIAKGLPILACKTQGASYNYKSGFIDKKGNVVVPFKYDEASSHSVNEELAHVTQSNKHGFIDKTGKVVIPLIYGAAGDFSEGVAPVLKGGLIGYVNSTGELVIKPQFKLKDAIYSLSLPSATEMLYGSAWASKYINGKYKWGLIDKDGNPLTEFIYKDATRYSSYYSEAKDFDGRVSYIDPLGRIYNSEQELSDAEYRIKDELADKHHNITALREMGIVYLRGKSYKGISPDYDKAYRYLKEAVAKGDVEAKVYMAYMAVTGKAKVSGDIAFTYASDAAKCGDMRALHLLGYVYANGIGTSVDHESAKQYFAKAKDLGCDLSSTELAVLNGEIARDDLAQTTTQSSLQAPQTNLTGDLRLKLDQQIERLYGNFNDNTQQATSFLDLSIESFIGAGQMTQQNAVTSDQQSSVAETRVNVPVSTAPMQNSYEDQNEKRIALIIGNSAYTAKGMALKNPANDATDVAQKLQSLGFDVIPLIDGTLQQTEEAIRDFGDKAKDYDVALFYYAGHGIQSKGINYLVPIDADLVKEEDLRYKCTDANYVLDMISGTNMKIVILDACRDNPLPRSWHRGIQDTGFVSMKAPKGTFIHYSTAADQVAFDGIDDGRNSPYSAAFLETLDIRGLSIFDFFQEVLLRVEQRTDGRQTPWSTNSFSGRFVFNR